MPIKVKYSGAIIYVKGFLKEAQAEFRAKAADGLGEKINDVIVSGTSPVQGVGRFADYSESYKKQIDRPRGVKGTDGTFHTDKRKRPVNLFVSGDMLASQVVKVSDKGVTVSYGSKFAEFHNATGRVLRRMLPTRPGEEFSRVITKFLKDTAASAVAKVLRK